MTPANKALYDLVRQTRLVTRTAAGVRTSDTPRSIRVGSAEAAVLHLGCGLIFTCVTIYFRELSTDVIYLTCNTQVLTRRSLRQRQPDGPATGETLDCYV